MRTGIPKLQMKIMVIGGSDPQHPVTGSQKRECELVGQAIGNSGAQVIVPVDHEKHNLAHMVAREASKKSGGVPRLIDPDLAGSGTWETYRDEVPGIVASAYLRPPPTTGTGYLSSTLAQERIHALFVMNNGGPAEVMAVVQALDKGLLVVASGGGLASNVTIIARMLSRDPSEFNIVFNFAEGLKFERVNNALLAAQASAEMEIESFESQLDEELTTSATHQSRWSEGDFSSGAQ